MISASTLRNLKKKGKKKKLEKEEQIKPKENWGADTDKIENRKSVEKNQ